MTVRSVISVISAMVAVAACGARPSAPASPAIEVTTPTGGSRLVEVMGLPRQDLDALSDATPEEWQSILRVRVEGAPDAPDVPPMSGSYSVIGDRVRFTPDFSLDPQVGYRIVFQRPGSAPLELAIPATAQPAVATTRVTDVFPPDTLFENHLRVYIHFSAPMSNRRADDEIRLLDERGEVVDGAFLPLDVNKNLWNVERTRYTLLFDPGRVKRGILPNMEMGRPLTRGKRYTLVVDRKWRDAEGRPLADSFTRDFKVVAEALEPIVPAKWSLAAPRAGTREPLTVTFPQALDHALAQRTIWVATSTDTVVDGSVGVDPLTTRWIFTPREPWRVGEYRLWASSDLEDPAGNRIGRAFDYDAAERGEGGLYSRAEASLPFKVR